MNVTYVLKKNVLDLSVLHSYLNQINNKTLTPNVLRDVCMIPFPKLMRNLNENAFDLFFRILHFIFKDENVSIRLETL